MTIRIEEISPENQQDLDRIDETFTVDCVLDVIATGFGNTLHFSAVAPYEKHYPAEAVEVSKYINSDERAIYFAYADNVLAGQIILRRWWNRCAYIEDIAVDRAFQRRGIATVLMDRAADWARQHGFPAIMLETQDTNAPACRFYHAYGFKIGGYDRYLYLGTISEHEIAVFWYYLLRP